MDSEQRRRSLNGSSFAAEIEDGQYRVYDGDGAFMLLARAEAGVMTTIKSFFEV
jgi:hypothetical protein